MRAKILFLTFFTLLLFPIVAQAQFSVSLEPKQVEVLSGETSYALLKVINRATSSEVFTISIWPERLPGILISSERYMLRLSPLEQASVKVLVRAEPTAREMIGLTRVKVLARSTGEVQEELLSIKVLRKFAPMLTSLTLNKKSFKPNETVYVEITVKNIGVAEKKVLLQVQATNREKIFFAEKELKLSSFEEENQTFSFQLHKHQHPGIYSVEAILLTQEKELIGELSESFLVEQVKEKKLQVSKSSTPFGIFAELKATNVGNVNYTLKITETLPKISRGLFFASPEPTSVEEVEEALLYSWEVTMQPGESVRIRYQAAFYVLWVAGAAAGGVGLLFYRRVSLPTLTKKHRYKGPLSPKHEIPISIELKNRHRKEIRRIEVEDFVPSLARVVRKFETLKPSLKEKDEGTTLLWKIPHLRPGEERVLTYRIKPVVDIVGTLNLPAARMSYQLMKRKRSTKSYPLSIGG